MIKKLVVILFFLGILGIYLHNLTRDIYSGDVGDLVTASVVHGVAHPPGYPLFTLFGFLLSKVSLAIPPVSKVGLISVFSSLFGLVYLYLFAKEITKSIFLSLITVSILAFSYLFWLHAEIPEVFALNNFFVIAILYYSVKFYKKKKLKWLYLATFLTALSLTHHHTILLIFPAIGLLIIRNLKIIFRSRKTILTLILLFTVGLLPYLYVPLAARTSPVINWDNVVNLQNFIHLLLRQDYGGFAPSVVNGVPFIVKGILARDFLKTLVTLYSYQTIFLAIVGMIALFKKDKWLLFSLLTGFVIAGPLFIFYSASVITTTTAWGVNERFYLLASVVFIFFVPYGFAFLKQYIDKRVSSKILTYVLLSYFIIVPFFLIKYNFVRTDLSKTQIGNNLALDILSFLPKDAVLFVSGDTTSFNIWYTKYALRKRPDVDIVNPGGVGGNSFLDGEINKYFQINPRTNLNDVVHKTIENLRKKRRIFSTYNLNVRIKDTTLVPIGLVYELMPSSKIPTKEAYLNRVELNWRRLHIPRRETLMPSEQNLVTPELPLIYSNGLIRVGDFLVSHYNDPAKSEHYYRRAQWIDPDNPGAHAGLGLSLYKAYKDCKESVNQMNEAIALYKIWKKYYLQLYILYDECNADKKTKEELKNLYKNNFKEDLEKKVREQLQ